MTATWKQYFEIKLAMRPTSRELLHGKIHEDELPANVSSGRMLVLLKTISSRGASPADAPASRRSA